MSSISEAGDSPLLILALPGLDGAQLRRLVDGGTLPRLAALFDEGTWAPWTPPPGMPAAAWTTVATGEWPEVHGVLQARVRRPGTLFDRPADAAAWRLPGLATLAAAAGRRVACIGWPATRGLRPPGGWTIAPEADLPPNAGDAAAPIDPCAAWPADAARVTADLRVHPRDLAAADVAFFVDGWPRAAQERLAPAIADALARAATRHARATQALAALRPALLMLHWPLLADLAEIARAEPAAAAQRLAERGLRFLDATLAAYGQGERPPRLLLLSDRGLALAAGPGVARDRMAPPLAAPEAFDLAAVLAGFAPAGRAPSPAVAAFLAEPQAPRQPLARPAPPPALTAADFPDDADALPSAREQAAAALAPPIDWAPWRDRARRLRRETLLALAARDLAAGRGPQGEAVLASLLAQAPDFLAARTLLAQRLWQQGRHAAFAALAAEGRRRHGDGPLADVSRVLEALAARDWPTVDDALARAMARPAWPVNLHLVAARAWQARGDRARTLASLEAAVALTPEDAAAWRHLGAALERAGRRPEAIGALRRALALQPGDAPLRRRLARLQALVGDAGGALASLRRAAADDAWPPTTSGAAVPPQRRG